jgi:DNA modification methylase
VKPYYSDDLVTIYHGDSREVLAEWMLVQEPGVVVTDPPYGIDYKSGQYGKLARSIANDKDTSVRDEVLSMLPGSPALVFGSWTRPAPAGTRMALVWDKGPALGMGALDLPWKPSWDLIFVVGKGFTGRRDGGVIYCPPVQSLARNGRTHPHEKPVALIRKLIVKCPPGTVLDPFMGTGSTLVAAKSLGRRAIGIELDEGYCEQAADRCSQEVLGLAV